MVGGGSGSTLQDIMQLYYQQGNINAGDAQRKGEIQTQQAQADAAKWSAILKIIGAVGSAFIPGGQLATVGLATSAAADAAKAAQAGNSGSYPGVLGGLSGGASSTPQWANATRFGIGLGTDIVSQYLQNRARGYY